MSGVWLLVAAPPVLAALTWLGLLGTARLTGTHPIWSAAPRNVAEAAALRDGAAVVRLVQQGADINRPGEVRARLVRSNAVVVTPVEAAAAVRQAEMVQLLFDLGAAPDAEHWLRAYCASDAHSVREVLATRRPSGAAEPESCD